MRRTHHGHTARTLVLAVCTSAAVLRGGPANAQNLAARVELEQIVAETANIHDFVHIAHAGANDPRLFLVEQAGRIWVYKNNTLLVTPFLDIRDRVAAGGERGLLSVAFQPDYPQKPYFYVYYTNEEEGVPAGDGDIVIARYQVPNAAFSDVADKSSGRLMTFVPHGNAGNHNGGQVAFGRDRMLYFASGDGGDGCDQSGDGCNAQREDRLLGKLCRIDVTQNENVAPYYGIPAGNPNVSGNPRPNNPTDTRRDEIWARGLRNPFRFSFDRDNGNLWIGDVGQGSFEEVDMQPAAGPAGRNYGWPMQEGPACGTCSTQCPGSAPNCPSAALTLPFHSYDRNVGSVIIGGFVYRGNGIQPLRGMYVFGDAGSGRIWAISSTASSGSRVEVETGVDGISSFGEDFRGELYCAILGQGVFRIFDPQAVVPDVSLVSMLLLALALTKVMADSARGSKRSLSRPDAMGRHR